VRVQAPFSLVQKTAAGILRRCPTERPCFFLATLGKIKNQAIHYAVGADRQNKDFDKEALDKKFGYFHSAKQLAKLNDDLSRVREGAVKALDAAVALLGRVKGRVDELSQGSTFMMATLHPHLQGRHLVTLRAGEYHKVIEYINPY